MNLFHSVFYDVNIVKDFYKFLNQTENNFNLNTDLNSKYLYIFI